MKIKYTIAQCKKGASKERPFSAMPNVDIAHTLAAFSTLAAQLQFIHGREAKGEDRQKMAPAVSGIVKACDEILETRSPLARVIVKDLSKEYSRRFTKLTVKLRATHLEMALALIEYLDYLRTSKIGMDKDELFSSLTVYNIMTAYRELVEASAIDVSRANIAVMQSHLLRNLR